MNFLVNERTVGLEPIVPCMPKVLELKTFENPYLGARNIHFMGYGHYFARSDRPQC